VHRSTAASRVPSGSASFVAYRFAFRVMAAALA
jgi:hypothetical protein